MLQAPRKADPTPPLQCPSPHRLCFLLCCQGDFVVLLLMVFVIPAQPRPTWAQHLDLGLILIARSLVQLVHVCLAVTGGRWGGGCHIAALVNGELCWTRTLTTLYHGWCLHFLCHGQSGCSLPAPFPVLIFCATSLHSFNFILTPNHLSLNSWEILNLTVLHRNAFLRQDSNKIEQIFGVSGFFTNMSPVEDHLMSDYQYKTLKVWGLKAPEILSKWKIFLCYPLKE